MYPPECARTFPQNIDRVLFQWNRGAMSLYQLEFTSPVLTYRIYTDGAHDTCTKAGTGGGCWGKPVSESRACARVMPSRRRPKGRHRCCESRRAGA